MGDKYQPSSRELMLISALSDLLLNDSNMPDEISEYIKLKLLQLKGIDE